MRSKILSFSTRDFLYSPMKNIAFHNIVGGFFLLKTFFILKIYFKEKKKRVLRFDLIF